MDRFSGLESNVVVQDSEFISFRESEFQSAHWGVDNPFAVGVLYRLAQARCPFREVLRLGDEGIYLIGRTIDGDAS